MIKGYENREINPKTINSVKLDVLQHTTASNLVQTFSLFFILYANSGNYAVKKFPFYI